MASPATAPAVRTAARAGHRLAPYRQKRDFAKTTEPRGEHHAGGGALTFVIQKHAASHLHYDFRLELDGVLVSWAVPKGPSFDPADKRMAIHVEDHPLSYASFEGTIPPKQYGAGTVIVWDHGSWEPVGDPHAGLQRGKLVFRMHGQKMAGLWELVKIAKGGERQAPWLLFKKRDEFARARADYDVVTALPDSVIAKPLKPVAASGPVSGIPPGAVKRALPATLVPHLATLASGVPAAGSWRYELKFDGYRILARIDNGAVRLVTRHGHDWSARLPTLVRELKQLGLDSAWLDGEIVAIGADGAPDFNALQKAFDQRAGRADIVYFLFDLPYLQGQDLRGVALTERRRWLKVVLARHETEHLRYSADFEADPASLLDSACRMHLEGVIAKRSDSTYVARRSDSWLKLKCRQRQEFVVCGYTARGDDAARVGSLLLGVHDTDGTLVSVGSVGTGWDADEARRLALRLKKLVIPAAPFVAGPAERGRWSRRGAGSEHWVEPRVVAEVEFAAWTPDGKIRHAVYVALRSDKPARTITREIAKAPVAAATAGRVKVTHGDRVIDASTRLTKLDLARYYASITPWLLPHLRGRPCSLVRGPTGIAGPLFFQKHAEKIRSIPGIKELNPALWPGHDALLAVDTAEALAGAVQMNTIEFHTWNSTTRTIDKPNRVVFDLDPGEGTAWGDVREAAALTRSLLSELGLEAWLKTSGGKGLHVVVPIAPRWASDTVKAFSRAVVQHMAAVIPARFVAKSGPANRVGKLFVDYLRNGHGATTVAAFSARARPGLGVSMPVSWEELATLKSGAHWTIATAREHVSLQTVDPWAGYWTQRQSLTRAMKALGVKATSRSA